jgi:ABC-2 type transport system ATP-binding protein
VERGPLVDQVTSIATANGSRPEPIVAAQGLTKRYGDFTAVAGIDLAVEAGEVFGLLGPNGAGKTTTIKMLVTLLPPDGGTAFVGGYSIIRQAGEVRRVIGYVPQSLSADGTLTGFENLWVFAKLYDVPRREQRGRVDEALRFMGLEDAAQRLVRTYSGGMVRRLEIAQALLHQPAVLFLDEPTIGLDPIARRAVWDKLLASRRQFATTILITTHDMEEAEVLCDVLAIMHAGRVAALGSPADLKRQVGGDATLDDVFAEFAGGTIAAEGSFRDIGRRRQTASRLG